MDRLLVLVRHGQSEWNLKNLFTGWRDVDLTEQGVSEAKEAGRKLKAQGLVFDIAFTSALKRAQRTLDLALAEMGQTGLKIVRDQALNERDYGDLSGLNKDDARKKWGEEQVHIWRRSYDIPPQPIADDPSIDERNDALPPEVIPKAECLADVVSRMLPYWYDGIVPDLVAGRTVLVAAHGNSLRALAAHLEGLSRDEVIDLNIPTGQPRVYELDEHLAVKSWRYLDPEGAAAAADAVKRQAG